MTRARLLALALRKQQLQQQISAQREQVREALQSEAGVVVTAERLERWVGRLMSLLQRKSGSDKGAP